MEKDGFGRGDCTRGGDDAGGGGGGGGTYFVVGLQFGNKFSSLAVLRRPLGVSEITSVSHWPGHEDCLRTLTSLYYEKKDRRWGSPKYEVTDWGWQAEKRHRQDLRASPGAAKGLYVTQFVQHLASGKAPGNRQQVVVEAREAETSHIPDDLTLETVITDYLKRISGYAIEQLDDRRKTKDVRWCLTLPAVCGDSARETMRKCAQRAGMVTGQFCPPQAAAEASSYPLRIVLEPEAAAVYGVASASADIELNLKKGCQVLVADTERGTIYTVARCRGESDEGNREATLGVAVLQQSSFGFPWESYVDINFFNMLRARIGCFDEVVRQCPYTLSKLQRRWAKIMASYKGSEGTSTVQLELPPNLTAAWYDYDCRCKPLIGVDEDYNDMQIDMKQILHPVVDRVIDLIRKNLSSNVRLMFLYGGLSKSESPYLRRRIKAAFASSLGDGMVIPPDPSAAVSRGAVMSGFLCPITSLESKNAYGWEELDPINPDLEPPNHLHSGAGQRKVPRNETPNLEPSDRAGLPDSPESQSTPGSSVAGENVLRERIHEFVESAQSCLKAVDMVDASEDGLRVIMEMQAESSRLSEVLLKAVVKVQSRRLQVAMEQAQAAAHLKVERDHLLQQVQAEMWKAESSIRAEKRASEDKLQQLQAEIWEAKDSARTFEDAKKNLEAEKCWFEAEMIGLQAEMDRIQADKDRIQAERNTIEAAKNRVEAEKSSIEAEKNRIEAERNSIEAAKYRVEAEKSSIEAEKYRIEVEIKCFQDSAAAERIVFENEKARIEARAREDIMACQICYNRPRNVVLLPCSHGQYCDVCMEDHRKRSSKCPTCRSPIKSIIPCFG